jgi:hypothetical protein
MRQLHLKGAWGHAGTEKANGIHRRSVHELWKQLVAPAVVQMKIQASTAARAHRMVR